MKKILITFFDINVIIHFEFLPQKQRVDQAYYVEIFKRLHEAVRRKTPEIWPNVWILHHDNAPAHKALCIKQFLVQKPSTELEHQPLSPIFGSE
jgi:hypothetical protein